MACSECAKRAAARKAAAAAMASGIDDPVYEVRVDGQMVESFNSVSGAAVLAKSLPGASIHLVSA